MIHVSGADVYQKQSFADVVQNRCSCKFRKFHRKAPVLESPFNKVAGPKAYQFVDKRLQHMWFHVKFLRKSCFTEHLSLVAASGLWLFTPAKFILGSLMAIFHLWCHHLHIKDVSSYICPRLHITAGEIINKLSVEALKSVQVNYFSRIVKSNRISSLRGVFRTLIVLFAKIMKRSEAVVQRCSVKKVLLEISQNCFPVMFVKFLRTPFFTENLCWVLPKRW